MAGEDGGDGGGEAQQEGGAMTLFRTVSRFFLMYYGINAVMRYFKGPQEQQQQQAPTADESLPGEVRRSGPHRNLWRADTHFGFALWLSEEESFMRVEHDQEGVVSRSFEPGRLVWEEEGLQYNWLESNTRELNITVPLDEHLLSNGTLHAHLCMYEEGFPVDPDSPNYDHTRSYCNSGVLVRYGPPPKNVTVKNLIETTFYGVEDEHENDADVDSPTEDKPKEATHQEAIDEFDQEFLASHHQAEAARLGVHQEAEDSPFISYWVPTLPVNLVVDHTSHARGGIPSQMLDAGMKIDRITGDYYPPLYFNHFWTLKSHLIAINDTLDQLPLQLSFTPMGIIKWQVQSTMEASFQQQASMGLSSDTESDEFRRILLEGNPYLLAVTFLVSILHSLFDFLAFKNDIQFWNEKNTFEGISVRSIFVNCGCQLVILLYLLENETSWMILISQAVGIAIEFWKIKKAADVTYGTSGGWFNLPWIKIEDTESYQQSETSKHDKEAHKYLSWVLYPLVVGYSVYSLLYEEHKSWYRWVLGSLVGTVYTFGFIMMCPQLYLNYKLKSVAHLPWRMLSYKFFNTIIDDLFAFVIKMPIAHRIACFRDDIIFLIFLYQRWIYRIDYSRPNEFGLIAEPGGGGDKEEKEEEESEPKEGEKKSVKEAKDSEKNKGDTKSTIRKRK